MTQTVLTLLLVLLLWTHAVVALDNGAAPVPPMGWLSWQRFGCATNCKNDPDKCISEKLYMQMADRMVADGYRDAGYTYVNIDDCWSARERDPVTFRLKADPDRFPSGMKALADYMHTRGLKLGIYGDMGHHTCAGWPGNKFTMELDAQTFADWGIDSFKMDGCNTRINDFDIGHPIMGMYMNKTGRPILYSCEWAVYQLNAGRKPNLTAVAETCNLCRVTNDIRDNWVTVQGVIESYEKMSAELSAVQGPGYFHDPDMLIVGDNGLSIPQQQIHFALWAMWAAPMYMSGDLRHLRNESRDILLHPGVIAISQDKLAIMAKFYGRNGPCSVWARPLVNGSYAVALANLHDVFYGYTAPFKLGDIGIKDNKSFKLTNVYTGEDVGTFKQGDVIKVWVDVSSVFLGKFTPTS